MRRYGTLVDAVWIRSRMAAKDARFERELKAREKKAAEAAQLSPADQRERDVAADLANEAEA